MLLWTIEETARQLGNVSRRTVYRLLAAGVLPKVKVMGATRIPPGAVADWVERMTKEAQNQPCAAPVAWKEIEPCHTDVTTRLSGGLATPTQAAAELDALLAQLTDERRKPSKRSGNSKPTRQENGGRK